MKVVTRLKWWRVDRRIQGLIVALDGTSADERLLVRRLFFVNCGALDFDMGTERESGDANSGSCREIVGVEATLVVRVGRCLAGGDMFADRLPARVAP